MILTNETNWKIDKDFFDKIAKKTFGYLNEKDTYDFDLVIVDKKKIKFLNNKYRKINKITDVLSFRMDEKNFFGQIFICKECVAEQAKKTKNIFKKELAEVFIHGLLHLWGYSDETQKGYRQMKEMQKFIMLSFKNEFFN